MSAVTIYPGTSAFTLMLYRAHSMASPFPVPTIAAMEGYALGGGLELALACDLRIAGESCKMGFPEITLGIMPGGGGTARAPRLVGAAKAMELIFTGSIISAPEALRIGLVNQTAPDGEVLPQAQKLAGRISSFGRAALETAKQTILEGSRQPSVLSAAAVEYRNWPSLFATQDQKEGMHAFLEKRKPFFTDC